MNRQTAQFTLTGSMDVTDPAFNTLVTNPTLRLQMEWETQGSMHDSFGIVGRDEVSLKTTQKTLKFHVTYFSADGRWAYPPTFAGSCGSPKGLNQRLARGQGTFAGKINLKLECIIHEQAAAELFLPAKWHHLTKGCVSFANGLPTERAT